MQIGEHIASHTKEFIGLCKSHHVVRLFVFGSALSSQFDADKSDVDILVTVDVKDPTERGLTLISLWDELELFFRKKVDLLTDEALKNPYLINNIQKTKKLIYDRAGDKVSV